MKLLHVVASYLPATRYGGTIVSVHGLCRALAERGHDVHVYTTSVDGPRDSDVPHGVPVDVDGVKVWYFRATSPRFLYRAPDLGAALGSQVDGFDVVHTHAIFLWPLWAAARAARRADVPYVVSPRGMLERDLIGQKNPLMKGLWIAAIERHNLERAAAIHVTSRREADQAAVFGFSLPPIHEVPNGVTVEVASGAAAPAIDAIVRGEPYVLFLGRINWKKGLDRLIAAVPHADVRLVIAGNDEDNYRAVLDALAARLGVSARVTFTGAVHGADKAALIAASRALVLPSYSENFGNVVLEAMAVGRPVIVTPEVGISDLVRSSGGGVVVNGAPQSLGAVIAALASDVARGNELGQHGLAASRRYSWAGVAERMAALYESIRRPRAC